MIVTDRSPRESQPPASRVVIANLHEPILAYVRLQFETWLEYRVVAETGSGAEALRHCRTGADLLILDLALHEMEGDAVVAKLREEQRPVRTILYTLDDAPATLRRAAQARPHGWVSTREPLRYFRQALESVASGGLYRSPQASQWEARLEREPEWPQLSARELTTLQMVAKSTSTKKIAEHLHMSTKSVEAIRSALLVKLGVEDMVAMVLEAARLGLLK